MAHAQYLEEMIKEYLLFRGFGNTVKAFDAELKTDKEKGFRVDKIIEQLLHFINTYDLASLRELWSHFENHLFSKLESHFVPGIKKIENAVLKMYLINTVVTNKPEKMNEFFNKLTPELQGQSEWKDWFMLPYIKNPEENAFFQIYFSKQWQDTCLVSLHNFLASIYQFMPMPKLLQYEEDANKIRLLEEKNDQLTKQINLLVEKSPENTISPCLVEPPQHLLDDFYIIAQESAVNENQTKSFKNLIRNMGSGPSPILGRKDNASYSRSKKLSSSVSSKSAKSGQSFFYDS